MPLNRFNIFYDRTRALDMDVVASLGLHRSIP